jgi:hypothetical protein
MEASMPSTSLDAIDAIELAELLQFIVDWLGSDKQLRPSFVGCPAYGIDELQHDLRRFTFLLGGDDGETLFRADRDDAGGEDP